MKLISHPIFLKHDLKGHPESKSRLVKALKLFKYEKAKNGENYLQLVHTKEYIDKIKKASSSAGKSVVLIDSSDTYVNKYTYESACYAVGATIQAATYAQKGKSAFAIVRPPGHHAHPDWTNGFCIFNNVAIAAVHFAEKNERVLILDIDMHRGDGTGDCISQLNPEFDNRIYYLSFNQQGVFPGVSLDEGQVSNFYFQPNTSENDYIKFVTNQIESTIKTFKPTLIAISAGFDSFVRDKYKFKESLGCDLNCTSKTIKAIKDSIKGYKYFCVLEGGYDSESVIEGISAFADKKVNLSEAKPIKNSIDEKIIIPVISLPKEKPQHKEKPIKIPKIRGLRTIKKKPISNKVVKKKSIKNKVVKKGVIKKKTSKKSIKNKIVKKKPIK